MSTKRVALLAVLTVLFSFSASLLFAEIILRAHDWYKGSQAGAQQLSQALPYEFSPVRHHRLIPNARYRHQESEYDYVWANNSLGMRDRERLYHKDPDSFRILFLGDSMIQGYGVPLEQSMVYRLEASLNQPPREKIVEVLNAGVFGYGPLLEYRFLQELLPMVEPDVVLVGFFLGNDVGDDYFYTGQLVRGEDGLFYFADMKWPWDYRNEVLNAMTSEAADQPKTNRGRSYFSSLRGYLGSIPRRTHIWRTIKEIRDRRRKERDHRENNERIAKLIEERKDDIRINLGLVNYPIGTKKQRLEYWQLSHSYLKKMHQACQASGVPMVLVVIPILEAKENQFEEPYEVLDEIGRELQIPVIQLLSGLSRWPLEEFVYKVDGHWNAEGNRRAAIVLDKELRKLNVLPAPLRPE